LDPLKPVLVHRKKHIRSLPFAGLRPARRPLKRWLMRKPTAFRPHSIPSPVNPFDKLLTDVLLHVGIARVAIEISVRRIEKFVGRNTEILNRLVCERVGERAAPAWIVVLDRNPFVTAIDFSRISCRLL
jgi:hypothetical protein